MTSDSLLELKRLGQSVWLDDFHRRMLFDGQLARLIEDHGLGGITTNPTIFERAITSGSDYREAIGKLAGCLDSQAAYTELVLQDISAAADLFRSVYERSAGRDGYVSLEVSPHLADEAGPTIETAGRLFGSLDRPNVLIKVPGTPAGLAALQALVAAGVNVNVTLLFSPRRYAAVIDAYLTGLESRLGEGRPLGGIVSVASFFLSRIDVAVDRELEERHADPGLLGRAAIASASLAYAHYRQVLTSARWETLSRAGAQVQRLLWASTGAKVPRYSDIMYVEELIAADTINTMPLETLRAYLDHGRPQPRLERHLDRAEEVLQALEAMGVDLERVAQRLEREGVRKFVEPYDRTLAAIDELLSRSAGKSGRRA